MVSIEQLNIVIVVISCLCLIAIAILLLIVAYSLCRITTLSDEAEERNKEKFFLDDRIEQIWREADETSRDRSK